MMKLIALVLAAVSASLTPRLPSKPFEGLKESDYADFFTVDAKPAASTGLPNCNSWKCHLKPWTATHGEKAYIAVDYDNQVDDAHCDDEGGKVYEFQDYLLSDVTHAAYAGINLVVKKDASEGLAGFVQEVRGLSGGTTIPLRLTIEYDDFMKLKSGQYNSLVPFYAAIEKFFVIAPVNPPTVAAREWAENAKLVWIASNQAHADKFPASYDASILIQEVAEFSTNPFNTIQKYCS